MSGSFHLSPISIPQLAGIAGCLVLYDHTYEIPNFWQSFPMTFLEPNEWNLFSTLQGPAWHNFMINDSIFVLNSNCGLFDVFSITMSPQCLALDIFTPEYEFKETFLSFWQTLVTQVLLLLESHVLVIKTNVGRFGHVHHHSGLTATTGFVDRFWLAHIICFTRGKKNYFISEFICKSFVLFELLRKTNVHRGAVTESKACSGTLCLHLYFFLKPSNTALAQEHLFLIILSHLLAGLRLCQCKNKLSNGTRLWKKKKKTETEKERARLTQRETKERGVEEWAI